MTKITRSFHRSRHKFGVDGSFRCFLPTISTSAPRTTSTARTKHDTFSPGNLRGEGFCVVFCACHSLCSCTPHGRHEDFARFSDVHGSKTVMKQTLPTTVA